jgi:hypothetical protein
MEGQVYKMALQISSQPRTEKKSRSAGGLAEAVRDVAWENNCALWQAAPGEYDLRAAQKGSVVSPEEKTWAIDIMPDTPIRQRIPLIRRPTGRRSHGRRRNSERSGKPVTSSTSAAVIRADATPQGLIALRES